MLHHRISSQSIGKTHQSLVKTDMVSRQRHHLKKNLARQKEMPTKLIHMIGRPGDPIMTFCAEKCNCTQIATMTFERLGHDEAKSHSWVHDYRWGTYFRTNPPPTIEDVHHAKTQGCQLIKFVRDPVERFKSIFKHHLTRGVRRCQGARTVDEFLSWLETQCLFRYDPKSYRVDDHVMSQAFLEETDDLWTEIIHVETFHDASVREYLYDRYGLRVDPEWTSSHWQRDMSVELTETQIERIKKLYWMDLKYSLGQ